MIIHKMKVQTTYIITPMEFKNKPIHCTPEEDSILSADASVANSDPTAISSTLAMRFNTSSLDIHVKYSILTVPPPLTLTTVDIASAGAYKSYKHFSGAKLASSPIKV